MSAPSTACEMTNPHHPDCECAYCKAGTEEPCDKPALCTIDGTTRSCGGCSHYYTDDGGCGEVVFDDNVRFAVVHHKLGILLQRGNGNAPTYATQDRAAVERDVGTAVLAKASDWVFRPVVPDRGTQASRAACEAAGLGDAWPS